MGSPTASAQIYIGGTITRQKILDQFIKLADNHKEFLNDIDIPTALDEAQKNGEPFNLDNSDARYGEFKDLEDFCMKNKLSYVRYTGSDGVDITPMVQWWVPGMEKPKYMTTNTEGEITLPLYRLTCVFNAIDHVQSQKLPKALPLMLKNEDSYVVEYVKDTLQRGGVPNPYEYLKQWVTTEYPVLHQDDLPPFKVEV
jgi:hypothetical protein